MNVLALDTCFSACSAAIEVAGGRIVHEHHRMDAGHAEALMPMIDRLLGAAGIGIADLDRIVVTHGPGTFTGVRTGIAAARGFALASRAGVIGVSSLWAIAVQARTQASALPDADAILVVMDARKGEVYAQVMAMSLEEQTPPMLLAAADAAALMPGMRLALTGSASAAVVAIAGSSGRKFALLPAGGDATMSPAPDARSLLQAASRAPADGRIAPLYLRAPDAKPQVGKSLPWSPP